MEDIISKLEEDIISKVKENTFSESEEETIPEIEKNETIEETDKHADDKEKIEDEFKETNDEINEKDEGMEIIPKSNHGEKTEKEEYEPITSMKITSEAMEKIFSIAEGVKTECYALLLGKDGIVYDIFVPNQSATGVSVESDEISIIEVGKVVEETGLDVLGWAHSHGVMDVFFSGTDDRNQERLLHETDNIDEKYRKFIYGMTVNQNRECIAFVTTQYKNLDVDMVEADVHIIPVPTDFHKINEKYKKIIKEKVKTFGTYWNGYTHNRKKSYYWKDWYNWKYDPYY